MNDAELLLFGLLVVAGLTALARLISVPYPIVLVIGGAIAGFIPGLAEVRLGPDLVLLIFLPPLLYKTAVFSNFDHFRANVRSLTLTTVGLVLATMAGVAWVAHSLADLPWPVAFALGAIVSPTDPVAATSVMRRLDVPRRLLNSVEGEGLFNDATALVSYRVAVAAVVAGSFSLAHAGIDFIVSSLGGVAVGLVVAFVIGHARRRVEDTHLSLTLSLLTPYAAYLPAERLGFSGVLATVAAGIFLGVRAPRVFSTSEIRLQGAYLWEFIDFLANAFLFVLVGLQLRAVVGNLSGYSMGELAGYALAVSAAVTGIRLAWLFTTPYVIRALDRRPSQRARRVSAAERFVIGWSGMRGAVSLAVALALPLATESGGGFPHRDLVVFLTFAVIFCTLVLQGLTLPAVIRLVGVTGDERDSEEETRARLVAAQAALDRLDTLAEDDLSEHDGTVRRMRSFYEFRRARFAARAGCIDDDRGFEEHSAAHEQIIHQVLIAQRQALLDLRRRGQLSNEVGTRLLRELDLEEQRLEF